MLIQGFDTKRLTQIQKHADERVEKKLMAGSCCAVYRADTLVWQSRAGYADITAKSPLEYDSIFRLASMSKPVTAVAIMILVERGLLRLCEPIAKYLPEFAHVKRAILGENDEVLGEEDCQPITFVHLLSHCSALAQDPFGYEEFERFRPKDGDTLETAVPKYAGIRASGQPGDRSGYGALVPFDILARIVEVVSGQTFDAFLKENLFGPLNMNDTTFHLTNAQKPRLVAMCGLETGALAPTEMKTNFPGLPESYESGGSGLFGTLPDYVRFARMLLNEGELDGARVLSPRSVERLRTQAMPDLVPGLGKDICWGLGMRVIRLLNGGGAPLGVGAFGWSGAFGTHFFVDPTLKLACVYMSNSSTAGGAGADTAFEFENDVMQALVRY